MHVLDPACFAKPLTYQSVKHSRLGDPTEQRRQWRPPVARNPPGCASPSPSSAPSGPPTPKMGQEWRIEEGRTFLPLWQANPAIAPPRPSPPSGPEAGRKRAGSWQALVRGSGVAARSVARVQQGLDAGTYDEGYTRFVIVNARQHVTAGHVTKEGGPCTKSLRTSNCCPST